MSTITLEKEVHQAWKYLRETNNTIPDDVIDLMKQAALEKIKEKEDENPLLHQKYSTPLGIDPEGLVSYGLKIKVNYSFTFGQKFVVLPCVNEVFSSKQILSKFLCSILNETMRKNLCKISCCVIYNKNDSFNEPDWYVECNGKLYFDDKGNLI